MLLLFGLSSARRVSFQLGSSCASAFAAQAEPLFAVNSLREYAEWRQALLTFMPDGRYAADCGKYIVGG